MPNTGELASAFDWWWLENEVASLGALELHGERAGRPARWTVDPGVWESKVRPAFSEPLLAVYLEGRARIEAGETERGVETWRRAVAIIRRHPLRRRQSVERRRPEHR